MSLKFLTLLLTGRKILLGHSKTADYSVMPYHELTEKYAFIKFAALLL